MTTPSEHTSDQADAANPAPAAKTPNPGELAARLSRHPTDPPRPTPLPAPGRVFAYVDNSNVWIEGMRLQAVRLGQARNPQEAMHRGITASWRYDFGRLYELACPEGSMVGRSYLVGSRPPPNDSVWERARREGFEVEVHDRNVAGKEKRVDTSLVTKLVADSFQHMDPELGDLAVLVAGDGDFLPPVTELQRRGLRVRVLSWRHACSRDLRDAANDYVELDPHFDWLTAT